MAEVVPAIIAESFDDLVLKLNRVKQHVSVVQIDVLDGKFAPTTSWPLNSADERFTELLEAEEGLPDRDKVKYEVDLMVEKPEKVIDDWMRLGVSSLIIHYGSTQIFNDIISEAHERGVSIGLAIKPSTNLEQIFQLIHMFKPGDFVQVMGNDKIGYHGVELDESVYKKVQQLRAKFPKLTIAVDIGINKITAKNLVDAGVNRLVSGSAIFGSDDIEGSIKYFQDL